MVPITITHGRLERCPGRRAIGVTSYKDRRNRAASTATPLRPGGVGTAAQAVGPGQTADYLRLPGFDGVCAKALAAAVLSAFDDFGFASTLPAADAAFEPVCRLFRAICTTSSAV